jgi:hypothetical protein
MMASLTTTSQQSPNRQQYNHRLSPLQAISEHFYIDTEKSTAAMHAKQVASVLRIYDLRVLKSGLILVR